MYVLMTLHRNPPSGDPGCGENRKDHPIGGLHEGDGPYGEGKPLGLITRGTESDVGYLNISMWSSILWYTSSLTLYKTSILDHLGHHSLALVNYKGQKAPINIIALKSIEANEGWPQLRSDLLDAFIGLPQSISAPVVQVMIPHTCVTHQDNFATTQHATSAVSSTPMPSRMAHSTVSHSPFSSSRGRGDSGPPSTPVLAFKMPDPSAITSMPMPPGPSKKPTL